MDCKWAHNGNRRGMLRAFPLPIGGRVFGVFGPRNHNGEGVEEEGSGLLRLRLWVAFFTFYPVSLFFPTVLWHVQVVVWSQGCGPGADVYLRVVWASDD